MIDGSYGELVPDGYIENPKERKEVPTPGGDNSGPGRKEPGLQEHQDEPERPGWGDKKEEDGEYDDEDTEDDGDSEENDKEDEDGKNDGHPELEEGYRNPLAPHHLH